jgi:signal transduction histidine kinase
VPETLEGHAQALWPYDDVLRRRELKIIVDLDKVVPAALPAGPWHRPPKHAALVPISPSGETGRSGVLIAGLNPFRLVDESYRGFLGLVASQIAAAVANALAYEEERRRAEVLAELDRAKTAFFSNVSHEFRTPLTLMLSPIEDALDDRTASALSTLQRARIEVAHRNSLRLLKLVNSLLDFSRIEAGRAEAHFEPADLAKLTAELASNFESATERAGLRLNIDCRPLSQPVYVDCDMWEKLVLNLLSNAFKFTFEGEIAVRIQERREPAVAELVIQDTGVGVPKDELPRLFERFHRVEGQKSRSFEGSGIGLALVQELVKLHGGTIKVESEVGRGTRFEIAIPFGSKHLPPERIRAEPVRATRPS